MLWLKITFLRTTLHRYKRSQCATNEATVPTDSDYKNENTQWTNTCLNKPSVNSMAVILLQMTITHHTGNILMIKTCVCELCTTWMCLFIIGCEKNKRWYSYVCNALSRYLFSTGLSKTSHSWPNFFWVRSMNTILTLFLSHCVQYRVIFGRDIFKVYSISGEFDVSRGSQSHKAKLP